MPKSLGGTASASPTASPLEVLRLALPSSPSDSEDLFAELLPELNEFSSGEDVQKFLARLVVQVTRGSISPRRAAVLGYLTNQLLHSHRAIDKEMENEPQQFIFDLPRPKRNTVKENLCSPNFTMLRRCMECGSPAAAFLPALLSQVSAFDFQLSTVNRLCEELPDGVHHGRLI